jgi:nicotinamidase-related amidase
MKYGNGTNYWIVEGDHFDISRSSAKKAIINMEENRTLQFDPERSAFIIIDMQNYFCSPLLNRPVGALQLVPAISSAVRSCRQLGMKIIWVNWGNRPDNANLPPSLLYSWKRNGRPGLGEPLPTDLGLALVKDSWSAAIVDELKESFDESDYWVDKYRISGFPGTYLDQILRSNGITTLFFGGVNTDQCVMSTLQDAAFIGYDNILLRDCTATASPEHVLEGALYNMRSMAFTAVSDSLKTAASKEVLLP